jgi:hypothetical protein
MSVEQGFASAMEMQDWGDGCCSQQWEGASNAVALSPSAEMREEVSPQYHLPCVE